MLPCHGFERESESRLVVSDSLRPHGIYSPWNSPSHPEDLPNPGTEPRSPTLQADSLPAKPQGKPAVVLHKSLKMTYKTLHDLAPITSHTYLSLFFPLNSV